MPINAHDLVEDQQEKKCLLIMVRYAALTQINCSPLVFHTGTHRPIFFVAFMLGFDCAFQYNNAIAPQIV